MRLIDSQATAQHRTTCVDFNMLLSIYTMQAGRAICLNEEAFNTQKNLQPVKCFLQENVFKDENHDNDQSIQQQSKTAKKHVNHTEND